MKIDNKTKDIKDKAIIKAKNIIEESKNIKSYNTEIMFERIYASMWLKMNIKQLEKHRELLNKIIREKKLKLKYSEANKK